VGTDAVELALLAVALPLILAGLSVMFTVVHTREEVPREDRTIWEYLADVYPLFPRLGYVAGLAALLAFGGVQVWLAVAGYAGGCRACLWALLAVRLGDCVVSHWGPWLRGRRPNPGLMTTVLYAIDVVFAGAVLGGGVY
jgi:hypothetical protein